VPVSDCPKEYVRVKILIRSMEMLFLYICRMGTVRSGSD